MTDETTEQSAGALSVFTCINRRHPSRSCYALIENTKDVRIAHRQWHLDQETDREALRGSVKSRDDTIAKLREEISGYRRDVTAYGQEVAGFHGEVQRVETPIVPPQLEIDRGGYSDDELDDEPDEPLAASRDDLAPEADPEQPESAYAGEPAESGADDDDEDFDDEEDLATLPANPIRRF